MSEHKMLVYSLKNMLVYFKKPAFQEVSYIRFRKRNRIVYVNLKIRLT